METRQQLGQLGERVATEHLTRSGWTILERNYRRKGAEIDIVAVDDSQTTVFVEVRTRRFGATGGSFESITAKKFERIRRAAAMWLEEQADKRPVRIDAIGVNIRGNQATITHRRGIA
ncbi:MAG: YraN family protein [Actinomycetaceae bacterium]|nr:YraN family protein [Actinomycetaceae bacterium]